jgi:hypothetical protein
MKVDGREFLKWLHEIREASEQERKQKGVSGEEWLLRKTVRAHRVMSQFRRATHRRPASPKSAARHRTRVPA